MLKKILISCGVLLALLGLYAAAGFYLIPKLARDQLPGLLGDMTGQRVQLQAVHFDPFDFKADLQGLGLLLSDDKPLLSLGELAVDVDVVESISQRALVVRSLVLRQPVANIERNADGRFNFDDLIAKFSPTDQADQGVEPSSMPPVLIRQISLDEGQVGWIDSSVGEHGTEKLLPIAVSVSELNLAPGSSSTFSLSLGLESGGRLGVSGQFGLSEFKSSGNIKLEDLALDKAWQLFLQGSMPLEITDGHLSLHADYDVQSAEASGLQLLLNNAGIEVKQLVLNEKAKADPLIQLPVFAAKDIRLNLQNQQVDIGSVSASDADIKAWLQADGQVNYQALFASEAPVAGQAVPANTEPSKPWQISLGELALTNHKIGFTDFSQAKPVEMVFDQLNCALHDYRNADNIRLPVQFSTRVNNTGLAKLDGEIGLSPFSANGAVELQGIKLKTFQTYLDPFLNLELTDGDLNTLGHLQIDAGDDLQINYQGEANVNNLITRDKVKNLDFVKWDNLALKQMALDVDKQDFKLGRVIFDRPYVRFTIKKDGSNNVGDILVAKTEGKPAPAAKPSPKSAAKPLDRSEPVITIGKIELKQGQSDFADYSLILPFVVKMNDLNGEVDGFASNTDSAAKLKLQGKVRDLATVSIGGKYHLKSGDSDISMSFKHLPLPLVTPYMAEFAGYRIEKGQMALDLKYNIKDGQLAAQNKIFIDQLVLGEKVDNPKAVSLPLELGIALLKDGDGKINLDFPVTGSLEDPKFSVGSLVTDVLVNVITKAVSAPFKAIASLFDGEADLSSVGFAPGNSELSADETAKLDQIAKALVAKPELVLEIKGMVYQNQDWPVMRSDALDEILKKMKSGELRDKGEKIRSEYIELSADEYNRLLAKFYAEVFPQKFERTLFGAPRIKDKPDADFYKVAHEELEAVMQPDPQRLNDLAVSRANRIAKYLVEQGGIDRSRIYILATELVDTDSEGGIKSRLSLNVAS